MVIAPGAMSNPAAAPDAPGKSALPRRLGLASLILIVVAFNSPMATMAGFAQLSIGFGNGVGAPVSFLLAGTILAIFAAGFLGMSRHVDNPGAFYRLIIAGLGRSPGLAGAFLATTAYILLCVGSYPYMGLVAVDFMTRMTGAEVLPWQAWTIVFLLLITTLGLLRADVSMNLLGLLVCLEVALVALWEAAVIVRGGPEGYSLSSYAPSTFLHGSPGLGVLFSMLTMTGIEVAVCFRDETRDPETTVSRATFIAIGFLALFYSLGTWAYIVALGPSHAVHAAATNPVGSFVDSVQRYLGNAFVTITSLTVMTSTIVSINAIQGAGSRYLYALGRDRVLPPVLGAVHPRLESPHAAVLAVAVVSLATLVVIFVLGVNPVTAYAGLTGMGIYFILPLLILTSVAILAFYRRRPDGSVDRWSGMVAPATAAVLLSAIFVLTTANLQLLVSSPAMALASIIGVLAVPAAGFSLAIYLRRNRPEIYAAF